MSCRLVGRDGCSCGLLLVAGCIDGMLIGDHVCAADDCCGLARHSLFFILGFDRTFEGDLAMPCDDFYVVRISRQGFVRDDRLTNSSRYGHVGMTVALLVRRGAGRLILSGIVWCRCSLGTVLSLAECRRWNYQKSCGQQGSREYRACSYRSR